MPTSLRRGQMISSKAWRRLARLIRRRGAGTGREDTLSSDTAGASPGRVHPAAASPLGPGSGSRRRTYRGA